MSDYLTRAELLLFSAAVAGLLAHFLVKRLRGEIQCTLFVYLFMDHPGFTLATIISIAATCLGIVATGQIEDARPHIVLALGFGTGWTLDSAIGPRKQTTDDDQVPAPSIGHAP